MARSGVGVVAPLAAAAVAVVAVLLALHFHYDMSFHGVPPLQQTDRVVVASFPAAAAAVAAAGTAAVVAAVVLVLLLAVAAVLVMVGVGFAVRDIRNRPVPPIKEGANGVLASFPPPLPLQHNQGAASDEGKKEHGFVFGLATAPAHVEDELDDAWLDFAREGDADGPKRGPVRAWRNIPVPDQRLRFWTEPEIEIDLAAKTGVDAFRMGVDWGRLVPKEPVNGTAEVLDLKAVARYREIMAIVRKRGMRVMLTLFHHSFPKWGNAFYGWRAPKAEKYFVEFAELAAHHFGDLVDYWITFNEPHIFATLTYCIGAWPPGFKATGIDSALCMLPFVGTFARVMRAIARAHNKAYAVIKSKSAAPIGIAHNIGFITAYSAIDFPAQLFIDGMTLYAWVDQVQDHLDFCGLNYYGQEFLSLAGLQEVHEEEYSEAGRGVYPDGLYHLLVAFHNRYKAQHPNLRYIVTENGMADARDIIRRPYLIEHLLALYAAREHGVPIDGYFHWTISDNWEWADGYCPKFGLVDVDRTNNLTRIPRPSYELFTEIVRTRAITEQQRQLAWETLNKEARAGGQRPFCRIADPMGRMGADSLDSPTMRHIATRDWRYGEYAPPTLALKLRRVAHILACWTRDAYTVVKSLLAPALSDREAQEAGTAKNDAKKKMEARQGAGEL